MPTFKNQLAIVVFAPALALSMSCVADYGNEEEIIGDMSLEAQGDCAPVLDATPNEPQAAGVPITLSTTANCPSGEVEYRYYQQDLLGVWSELRGYDLDATFAWDTTGYAEGEWKIQVWVRRVGSGFNWEGAATLRYDIAGAASCSSVAFDATSPSSPSNVGTMVALSAQASCGGGASAEYQYWTRAPGVGWTITRAWDPSATYDWDTTGLDSGNHKFQVWTRAQGSAEVFQAWASTSHWLLTPVGACDTVSISDVTPVSPSSIGSAVTITAAATCTLGAAAEYKYILKDPAGTWAVLQDWSASDTAAWDTAADMAGTWRIQVWSRASGSSAALEGATPTRAHVLEAAP